MLRIVTQFSTDRDSHTFKTDKIAMASLPATVHKTSFFKFLNQIADFAGHYATVSD